MISWWIFSINTIEINSVFLVFFPPASGHTAQFLFCCSYSPQLKVQHHDFIFIFFSCCHHLMRPRSRCYALCHTETATTSPVTAFMQKRVLLVSASCSCVAFMHFDENIATVSYSSLPLLVLEMQRPSSWFSVQAV